MKAISKILALATFAALTSSASAAEFRKHADGRTLEVIEKCLTEKGFEKGRHFRKAAVGSFIDHNATNISGDGFSMKDFDKCWDTDGDPTSK